MSAATADRLRGLLAPVVAAAGLDLESVDVTPAGRRRLVRVAVDKDGGVTLDDVAVVSRSVSDALDTSDVDGCGAVRPRGQLARASTGPSPSPGTGAGRWVGS